MKECLTLPLKEKERFNQGNKEIIFKMNPEEFILSFIYPFLLWWFCENHHIPATGLGNRDTILAIYSTPDPLQPHAGNRSHFSNLLNIYIITN